MASITEEAPYRMSRFRRYRRVGHCCFFTVSLDNRAQRYLTDHIDVLKQCLRDAAQRRPFVIDAMVVLPDHLHTIWTLPDPDRDVTSRWQHIKAGFAHQLMDSGVRPTHRQSSTEFGLWQPRFWEHWIRNEREFNRHADYIHFNPVKHGWAETPCAWAYSSFHRYVAQGLYPAHWTGAGIEGRFGE